MLLANINEWMLFAGVSLMLVILLRRYWRYYGKLKKQNARAERMPSKLRREGVASSPLLDAPPEALRWQVEMHETARELKAELDSKIGVLQTLVRMADERIAALSIAAERERAASAERLVDEPLEMSSTSDASTIDLSRSTTTRREPRVSSATFGSEALRRSIFELAERGWDATAIAAEIERPVGDVEMILSLRTN